MPKITLTVSALEPECDFCSAKPVYGTYDAPDFETTPFNVAQAGITTQSIGHWGACKECADLIDADKWDDLALRATNALIEKNPWMNTGMILSQIRSTYKMLRSVIRRAN